MYPVTEKIKTEIISYCRDLIKRIKLDYLQENNVYQNEFLEFLYLNCIEQYEHEKTYELTDETIVYLFSIKKQNEIYSTKIKNKEIQIVGIDDADNFVVSEASLKKL